MQGKSILRLHIAAAALAAAAILAVDLMLPLGVAGGVPYVAVVLMGWWLPRRRHILYLALVSSALTVAGYYLSPPGGIPWVVLTNRALALFAIWVTAVLLDRAKRSQEGLNRAHGELETRVEERTRQLDNEVRNRERTLVALRESERRLSDAQRIARLGNWIWDIERDEQWWSGEIYRILGLEQPRHALTHEDFMELVHPKDRPMVERALAQALKGGPPYELDFRIVKRDGSVRTIFEQAEVERDATGAPLRMAGILQDITERKEAELRAQRLMLAIESLSECVALYDRDDRLVFCNAPYRDLNSAVLETLEPGTPFIDHLRAIVAKGLVPQAAGHEEQWLAERLERHRHPKGPIEILRQEGRWLLGSEKRLPDGGNVLLLTDITSRKQAEAERQVALERAEKASKAKTDFLAAMSHELRTPLNAILGFAEIIASEYLGPAGVPRYREYAEDIQASSRHLLELITEILDLSAIEAGKRSLAVEEVDIGGIAKECLRTVTAAARNKKISCEVAVEPGLPPLFADRRATRQILINLLSNAVKFTPEGGAVEVRVGAGGGAHRIAVSDNGSGIPADKLAGLTEPFTRADADPFKAQEGVGLGLSIVAALVRLHGGRLDINSAPAKGTTVTASLPTDGRRLSA